MKFAKTLTRSPTIAMNQQKKRKSVLYFSSQSDMKAFRPLVIVIGGPTAVGKSSVGAKLCSAEWATRIVNEHRRNNEEYAQEVSKVRGHIISADSVQAYQGVQIGANKPSNEERAETPHHLIDILDGESVCQYNAADWMRDALYVLDNLKKNDDRIECHETLDSETKQRKDRIDKFLLQQKEEMEILPVVVGGTMMYLQWLVHGKPDAMKPSQEAIDKAANAVGLFQSQDDETGWDDAVKYVSSFGSIFSDRISKLPGRDWYRLRRTLEVALTLCLESEKEEKMKELYNGEREGGLHESSAYDVRCFFLCPDDRMNHTEIVDSRCEDMICKGLLKETTDLYLSGKLPDQGQQARAIGYRQSLDYLKRKKFLPKDNDAFEAYVDDFATATRRYAKKQMQWFRKDNAFLFIPVPLTEPAESRIDNVAKSIEKFCTMSRSNFEKELNSTPIDRKKTKVDIEIQESGMSLSTRTKLLNEQQGKNMKFYIGKRHRLVSGSEDYNKIIDEADICTSRMQGGTLTIHKDS